MYKEIESHYQHQPNCERIERRECLVQVPVDISPVLPKPNNHLKHAVRTGPGEF